MHKVFGFLKSCTQFLKIIVLFLILLLLLYWIQNLSKGDWSWLNFVKPFLDSLLKTGEKIASGSIMLFEAVFEFKYMIACLLLLVLYYFNNLIYIILEKLEELYDDGSRKVRKIQEDVFNNSLAAKNSAEQKKIQKYQIYVSASVKKKYSHKQLNINLDEQLKIMNKFLMEKTGVNPEKFEEGFIYSFNHFDEIDSVLEIFFKLLKADTPLDYIICVQIIESTVLKEQEKIRKLISLKFENKISMFSDTSYRYRFNKAHLYGTSQLGLFQKGDDTFEAFEFIEI